MILLLPRDRVNDTPLFEQNATPSQVPGVDIDSLSEVPSSDEFFLYSRIDGTTTVAQLCKTSGLGRQGTLKALQSLINVGLVQLDDEGRAADEDDGGADDQSAARSVGARSASEAGEPSSPSSTASSDGIDLSHLPTPPSEIDVPDELLELDVPLNERKRRELVALHDQLDQLNLYQFFGVPRDADRSEIKRAYFTLSKRFHPDKHFRKDLGPFNDMLERVFQQITRAYRVLSKPGKRETYDQSISEHNGHTQATPMTQPSSVHMANEGAADRSGTDKRKAAFSVLLRRAEKLRDTGEYGEAADQYRKALSLKRDLKTAQRAARMLLGTEDHLDQAELFARAAVRINRADSESKMLLAEIMEQQNRPERARRLYREILATDEEHEEARRRLESLN